MINRPLTRMARMAIATTVSLTLGGIAAGPAQAGSSYLQSKADAAAGWEIDQLSKGAVPSSYGGNDWGLTIDTAFALVADGGHAPALNKVRHAFANGYLDYTSYEGDVYANSAAKALTAVKVLDGNPRGFGGHNPRLAVARLVAGADAGKEQGRVRDSAWESSGNDYSNTFGQAFAVIGLARTGKAPESTVTYLKRQQCADGSFVLYPVVNKTCKRTGEAGDADATSMAIQALVAAQRDGVRGTKKATARAARWLVRKQQANGGFGGGVSTEAPNANSTGLAAQALNAVGRTAPRKDAASFLAKLQLTKKRAGSGPAKADIGAISYDAAARKTAVESGITDNTADQFRRATAQGIFGFTAASLTTLRRR